MIEAGALIYAAGWLSTMLPSIVFLLVLVVLSLTFGEFITDKIELLSLTVMS